MSIESFSTSKISTAQGTQSAGALGASAADTTSGGKANANFFDLFLARLQGAAQNGANSDTPLASDKKNDTKLDLAKILENNEAILEDAKLTADLSAKGFDALMSPIMESDAPLDEKIDALQRLIQIESDQLDKQAETPPVLELLQSIIDANGRKARGEDGETESTFDTLLKLAEALKESNDPRLTTLNITPADMADLQVLENKEQAEKTQKIMDALDALAAEQSNDNVTLEQQVALNAAVMNAQNQDELAEELNTIMASAGLSDASVINGREEFESVLKQFTNETREKMRAGQSHEHDASAGDEHKDQKSNPKSAGKNTETKPAQQNQAVPAGISADFMDTLAMAGGMEQFLESIGAPTTSSLHVPVSTLANPVTQSAHAHHAHPATQAVAVTIQKMATSGEAREITMRLDPPDLGKVEVRMSFDADTSMKASLLIEKPETYFMLQKDSQMLERALQDAGLDTDGGLSFELAQEGWDFSGDNKRGGGHDNGGKGASDSQGNEILEELDTTMTWHIDPDSGHTRYDIFV